MYAWCARVCCGCFNENRNVCICIGICHSPCAQDITLIPHYTSKDSRLDTIRFLLEPRGGVSARTLLPRGQPRGLVEGRFTRRDVARRGCVGDRLPGLREAVLPCSSSSSSCAAAQHCSDGDASSNTPLGAACFASGGGLSSVDALAGPHLRLTRRADAHPSSRVPRFAVPLGLRPCADPSRATDGDRCVPPGLPIWWSQPGASRSGCPRGRGLRSSRSARASGDGATPGGDSPPPSPTSDVSASRCCAVPSGSYVLLRHGPRRCKRSWRRRIWAVRDLRSCRWWAFTARLRAARFACRFDAPRLLRSHCCRCCCCCCCCTRHTPTPACQHAVCRSTRRARSTQHRRGIPLAKLATAGRGWRSGGWRAAPPGMAGRRAVTGQGMGRRGAAFQPSPLWLSQTSG